MATASQKTTLNPGQIIFLQIVKKRILKSEILPYLTKFLVLILGVLTAAPNKEDPVKKIPLFQLAGL